MIDTELLATETKRPSGAQRNMPAVHRVVRLAHHVTRHIHIRTYGICNRALHQLETMPRPPGVGTQVARLECEVDERLTGLGRDLDDAIHDMRQQLAENGIVWDENHPGGMTIEALVSARRSAVYIGLLERFDALVGLLEMAQCSRILTMKDCREEIYRQRRRLTRTVLAMAGTIHKEADALLGQRKGSRKPR